MKKFFKYFHFNTVERNGFIVLFWLIILINLIRYIYSEINSKDDIKHQIYELSTQQDTYEKEYVLNPSAETSLPMSVSNKDIKYFKFDPNTASADEWAKLGLSAKQIQVILNYRTKGGRFYKSEDLQKIYSITDKDYKRLEKYIDIPSSKENLKFQDNISKNVSETVKKDAIKISINDADTAELKQLKGIGPVFAQRIVKFRDALGGFYAIDQLKEVYGITEETFEQIKHNIELKSNQVKKIRINDLDVNGLSRHPYISKKQANLIVNYRTQHGNYSDMDMLRKNKALDQDFFRKIEPYLEF